MQELYAEPIKEELIGRRIEEIKAGGVTTSASITPQRVERYAKLVLDAGLDILVIQGTVVSGEHVSSQQEPLNLKEFIPAFDIPVIVGGCASYATALHLMRTGRRRRARRRRPRQRVHHRGVLGRGCAPGDRDRRRGGSASRAPARDRPVLPRDRRRRHAHRRRHREGHRVRRRRRDDRLADDPRLRGAGARVPLGHGDLPPDPAAGRSGARPSRSRRSRRSSPARRTRTTARSTCSARSRRRWRRPATRRSRSSRRPSS